MKFGETEQSSTKKYVDSRCLVLGLLGSLSTNKSSSTDPPCTVSGAVALKARLSLWFVLHDDVFFFHRWPSFGCSWVFVRNSQILNKLSKLYSRTTQPHGCYTFVGVWKGDSFDTHYCENFSNLYVVVSTSPPPFHDPLWDIWRSNPLRRLAVRILPFCSHQG